jgi:hypothetical protein
MKNSAVRTLASVPTSVGMHDSKDVNLHCAKKTADLRAMNLSLLDPDFEVCVHDQGQFPGKALQEALGALAKVTNSLRSLAAEFGFSTFAADELTIDEDSYRPQKEGYEIGFETSASDAIRLKWAYQLGLLELSRHHRTNHPGMLLLDEPRQQSSSKVSFGRLLERAAGHRQGDQQVIVSTSEDLDTLTPILNHIECWKTIFEGYVIQPKPNRRL